LRTTAHAPNHQANTRTLRPCHQIRLPYSPVTRPASLQPGSLGWQVSERRERDWNIWNISKGYLTSPRDPSDRFHLCRLATIPSYYYMHLLLLLHQLPHAPAHHHNLSPKRSNPAGRPAAMYKVPPNRTLTPYLDVNRRLHYSQRRGRQAVRVAPCMLCRKNNTPLGLQSYQLPNPTAFFQAAAATRPYSTLSPSVKTRRQTIDFRNN
jgi:hypothetical protein